MDTNTIIWVSKRTLLGGAHYSAFATLPFAGNDLTSYIKATSVGARASPIPTTFHSSQVLEIESNKGAVHEHKIQIISH